MNNNNSINLLEQDIKTPCERVVNGFRFFAVEVSKPTLHQFADSLIDEGFDLDSRPIWIWRVRPNHCTFDFYFPSFRSAVGYFIRFKNNHSEQFWYERYYPFHFFDSVLKNLRKENLYE